MEPYQKFSDRCGQLGIACWRLELANGKLVEPEAPAALLPLLRSATVRTVVQQAMTAADQRECADAAAIYPGWTLLFMRDQRAVTAALLLSEAAGASAQFEMICKSAGLESSGARALMAPVLRPGGASTEQTIAVIRWIYEDLLGPGQTLCRDGHERTLLIDTLVAVTAAIDAKDPYTRGHSQRVGMLAESMARALKLSERQVELYRIAGLLHDVGKLALSEAVLNKQGRLSSVEIAAMQRHPELGHGILQQIPLLEEVLPGVLHHHERFDGFGYPHGLSGEQVPAIARVLALCDTFDAMSSRRSYREAMPREIVLEEIRRCSATQFDPELAEVFATLDFAPVEQLFEQDPVRQAA